MFINAKVKLMAGARMFASDTLGKGESPNLHLTVRGGGANVSLSHIFDQATIVWSEIYPFAAGEKPPWDGPGFGLDTAQACAHLFRLAKQEVMEMWVTVFHRL